MSVRSVLSAAVLGCWLAFGTADAAAPSLEDRGAVHWVAQEIEIHNALSTLSDHATRGRIVFQDVSLVDVVHARTLPHQSVVVDAGKIVWTGDAAHAPMSKDTFIIDGKGLFLSPGLVDMHLHTQSLGEQLLRLANGQTSVRDMDGFAWMLRLRRAVQAGALLAPTAYIAGTIIADQPLFGYAVVVRNETEARQQVNAQAACGYDFVKVHNSLALPLFDAVTDQARRLHKDVVGHIPHDISIDHVVHAGGMRTLEHLKGFISDRDSSLSSEDYAAALKGAQVWLTPTFYAFNLYKQQDQQKELTRPEMRFVALAKRQRWAEDAARAPDWRETLNASLPGALRWMFRNPRARLDESTTAAMARLLRLHPRWLAGTDSAQYDYQIPGIALLDELALMERRGIARADVLRAATSEPAAAMRVEGDFGQIKPGMRADLVLLAGDPLKNLSVFRANRGVMVRGQWLDRTALDEALKSLARIEAEPDAKFKLDAAAADSLAAQTLALSRHDIALDPMMLLPAAAVLKSAGYTTAAKQLRAADTDTLPGPCFETVPNDGG